MDNSSGIKLFNDESPDVAMPSDNIVKNDKFVEEQLHGAIDGAVIQKVLLPTTNAVDKDNYILDFTHIGTITVFQKEALKGLLYKAKKKKWKDTVEKSLDGREKEPELITIYLYRSGKDIIELGKGERFFLEKAIPMFKKYVFDDEITVYKNFDTSKGMAVIISEETVSFRLNL